MRGTGAGRPALVVAVVAWSPPATHPSALLRRERAALRPTVTRALGAGPWHLLRHELIMCG